MKHRVVLACVTAMALASGPLAARALADGPKVGGKAANFTLPTHDGKSLTILMTVTKRRKMAIV